ncbi:MAG: hypothetical protein ACKVS9_06190 [Phycisphaerae bacterium]
MLNLIGAIKNRVVAARSRQCERPFETTSGRGAWFENDEIHCYTMTRTEARVLARYWLRVHAWEKLKVENDDGICEANTAASVEAEERYRSIADLLGPTEVERFSREVERELGAPLLYRFDPPEFDGWKPSAEQTASLGVCPVCNQFDGVLAHEGEAWVYCESHRCVWRVNPKLVPREHPDYRVDQQVVLQRIVGFTVLPRPTPFSLKTPQQNNGGICDDIEAF